MSRFEVPDPDFFGMRELSITGAIVFGRGNHDSLFDHPAVAIDPEALRLVRLAHARARQLGLTLPAFPGTTVRFVSVPSAVGAQTRKRDGVIELIFNIVPGQPLGDRFVRLALHELMHVHQFAVDAGLSLEEMEEQAERFAWDAALGWRWG